MAFRWQRELPQWLLILALFVLGGLLGTLWLAMASVGFLLLGTVILIWYGYRLDWSDPNRLPPGRTLLQGGST